jgi:two-component system cell cycle response regulator DivK
MSSIRPEDATVVVVEDNFQNFVLITRLLAYLGVKNCEWKASGWQVLEFADALPQVDLILMDIFLPEADGYQALDTLRSYARFEDTLIVAVTADASVDNMQRAREAGFDGFIGKPLDPDRFPSQIRRILLGEAVWEVG